MGIFKEIYSIISRRNARASISPRSSAHQQIKLCTLNTENLFISLEHYDDSPLENLSESEWRKFSLPQLRYKQKPLHKLWGLASAILDIDPDVLMLVEVGGRESLDHFNHYFLKDAFTAHFVETNSNRSIDLAFLVKKDLQLNAKVLSNRETLVKPGSHYGAKNSARFARDVAELHLFHGTELYFILFLTHLKSKISTDSDFQGRDLRRAEAEALAALYTRAEQKYPSVPIVVGGDLNSDLKSPELEALARTSLTDFHDLLETPIEDRTSLVHFDHLGKPHPQVLDYLLLSPTLKTKIIREKSFTYRYKSFYDVPHPLPMTIHQRYHMPSDHFPVVLTLHL